MVSTGYKEKCNDCKSIWDYSTDYCPECGGENIKEWHLRECLCGECLKFNGLLKVRDTVTWTVSKRSGKNIHFKTLEGTLWDFVGKRSAIVKKRNGHCQLFRLELLRSIKDKNALTEAIFKSF